MPGKELTEEKKRELQEVIKKKALEGGGLVVEGRDMMPPARQERWWKFLHTVGRALEKIVAVKKGRDEY